MKVPSIAFACILTALSLAGCTGLSIPETHVPQTREITMWVEETEWDIHPNVDTPTWAFCAQGDGVEPLFSGPCGVPGPTIRVTKGDTIRLTFRNTHSIPHTVHFHGWHPFASDMNGAGIIDDSMLVEPGEEALIEWVAEPSGSFIYHCHFQTPTHMDMGMYGAFIVEDPEQPVPDQEFVAVLDEWAIHDDPQFTGNIPTYNFFTINGKSFPQTQPWIVQAGEKVRLHLVNAGFEFHAMHLHGYTPKAYEGVAGPENAVLTDVREVAPGQTVVMDLQADREGVWLFHDHVVPRVTAAADGSGFGAYPRGMLTVLVVGDAYADALHAIAPDLLAAAARDAVDPDAGQHGHEEDSAADNDGAKPASSGSKEPAAAPDVAMENYAFQETSLHVAVGTIVTWTNKDSAYHIVTADDGTFDSGQILAGESWSYTFTEPGTYRYHCDPHAYESETGWKGMVATVVVE